MNWLFLLSSLPCPGHFILLSHRLQIQEASTSTAPTLQGCRGYRWEVAPVSAAGSRKPGAESPQLPPGSSYHSSV